MYVLIYGREDCPFCVRAKKFAHDVYSNGFDLRYRYVDMDKENVTKEELTALVGKEYETVPQIFVDGDHVGGCLDFEKFITEKVM